MVIVTDAIGVLIALVTVLVSAVVIAMVGVGGTGTRYRRWVSRLLAVAYIT